MPDNNVQSSVFVGGDVGRNADRGCDFTLVLHRSGIPRAAYPRASLSNPTTYGTMLRGSHTYAIILLRIDVPRST